MLTLSANPILAPRQPIGKHVGAIEQDLLHKPHLQADRRFSRREHKADLRDARQAKTAAEAIGKLPGPTGAVHLVISGRFALWDMVPAIIDMTGATIDALHIATLGFSKRNINKMATLVDAGTIGQAWLLCSHYFAGTSEPIYNHAVDELAKRPERMHFLSIRTHAKVVLIALSDGRRVVIES